ncbi:SAM hydrolase/SAM-dependent halogenase family protein [Actinomadura scrupuli]|uniref:SAM hydrolase/SAM-dependent halogenase family protein n=1 Tax=Actinomadura scrupuli TaxID=559629 RepID=UPI003D99291C
MPSSRPFVSFTTDFGAAYTGTCAGVVLTIAPDANVLVLSDEVTQYSIIEGAMLLRQAIPYLPVGVQVGIVDPGVGTRRHPVAVATGRGDVLIGPDNGLLAPAAEALGGVVRAHRLANLAYRLPAVSATFHGRDLFAPAAGHVATGVDLADLGPAIDALVPLEWPAPVVGSGALTVSVLYPDDFGSLILSARAADLEGALGPVPYGTPLELTWTGPGGPRAVRLPYEETFGKVPFGEPLLFTDSSGWLGLAVNQGSAAARFELAGGQLITVRTPETTSGGP